jgi:hypothetical protein
VLLVMVQCRKRCEGNEKSERGERKPVNRLVGKTVTFWCKLSLRNRLTDQTVHRFLPFAFPASLSPRTTESLTAACQFNASRAHCLEEEAMC